RQENDGLDHGCPPAGISLVLVIVLVLVIDYEYDYESDYKQDIRTPRFFSRSLLPASSWFTIFDGLRPRPDWILPTENLAAMPKDDGLSPVVEKQLRQACAELDRQVRAGG